MSTTLLDKRVLAFDFILPLTSALNETILPFLPSFNGTPLATSEIPALTLSLSSSFPHSIPLCTLAQCALCRLSSCGAPLVYDISHKLHVRRMDVSIEKCSCVKVFLVSGFDFNISLF